MQTTLQNNKILLYTDVGDTIGSVEYVEHMGSDLSIVNSARVSFGKHKNTISLRDKKLIKYLIDHQHTSTLEHCLVTFRFKVPLYIRSQHMRHRTWSYNEISRRYTEENLIFYEPNKFRTQHKSNRQASDPTSLINPNLDFKHPEASDLGKLLATEKIKNFHLESIKLYDELLDAGVCREQARGVLPQNLYTEYYGTVNLNNLIKFVKLRTHEGAQWEIQQLANACLSIAKNLWPIAIESLTLDKKEA